MALVEPNMWYNWLMEYNWQQKDWTQFKYEIEVVEEYLFAFRERAGRIDGLIEGLPKNLKIETIVEILVSEAVKTSEIEGEYLNREDVLSSVKNNLGLQKDTAKVNDKNAEGAAELMVDVRNSFSEKLTKTKLFSWHQMVMKGNKSFKAGIWRTHKEPMQVVSGALGRVRVHFEAPPSKRVPGEMKSFIQWFNKTRPGGKLEIKKPVLRSAITHLYFETIHPFEDGNGRIGRALAEKALSQDVGFPILLSLSKAIEDNKKDYYEALKKGQRSNKITPWILYFSKLVLEAQNQAQKEIDFVLRKTKFFDHFGSSLNNRQLKVIKRMLEEGPKGFSGGMNAKKYMSITKTSKATATRDLQDLVGKGIFNPSGGGRSIHYQINL